MSEDDTRAAGVAEVYYRGTGINGERCKLGQVLMEAFAEKGFGLDIGRGVYELAVDRVLAAREASSPGAGGAARGTGAPLERVRHVKRGTEYEVLGEAEAQICRRKGDSDRFGDWRGLYEGNKLTVYRCVDTGKLWCRFSDEMRDGRFETIAAPAPAAARGGGDQGGATPQAGSGSQATPEAPADLRPEGFDPSRWALSQEAIEHIREIDLATVRPGDPRLHQSIVGPAGPAIGLDGYGSKARPLAPAPCDRSGEAGGTRSRPTGGESAVGGAEAPEGDWLWGKLMAWCRQRGVAPANYDDLFAIVSDARALKASDRSRPEQTADAGADEDPIAVAQATLRCLKQELGVHTTSEVFRAALALARRVSAEAHKSLSEAPASSHPGAAPAGVDLVGLAELSARATQGAWSVGERSGGYFRDINAEGEGRRARPEAGYPWSGLARFVVEVEGRHNSCGEANAKLAVAAVNFVRAFLADPARLVPSAPHAAGGDLDIKAIDALLHRAKQAAIVPHTPTMSGRASGEATAHNAAVDGALKAVRRELLALSARSTGSGGWRTMADCPTDGRAVWVFGGGFDRPTKANADGEWWRWEAREGNHRMPTYWHPELLPPEPSPPNHPDPARPERAGGVS